MVLKAARGRRCSPHITPSTRTVKSGAPSSPRFSLPVMANVRPLKMPPSTVKERSNSLGTNVYIAVGLIAMGIMAYGGWIAILQIYLWLKTDQWHEVSLLTLFSADTTAYPKPLSKWLPRFDPSSSVASWLTSPREWLGIHRIVYSALSYLGVGYTLTIGTWFAFMGITVLASESTERAARSHNL